MLELSVTKKLRDFSLQVGLTVAKGEILMLVGENGCGKTTILNMAAGLLDPDSGDIVLSGETLFNRSHEINLAPEARNIGYVFQNYALFPHLSVYENVAFGLKARMIPRQEIEERVRRQLEAAGLWEVRKARAARISGGQKQRVALARALVIEPGLLLLDEPFSAMDFRRQAQARRELKALIHQCGVPAIVVTHDLRDVACIGDRACLIEKGRVAQPERAEEVIGQGHRPGHRCDHLLPA